MWLVQQWINEWCRQFCIHLGLCSRSKRLLKVKKYLQLSSRGLPFVPNPHPEWLWPLIPLRAKSQHVQAVNYTFGVITPRWAFTWISSAKIDVTSSLRVRMDIASASLHKQQLLCFSTQDLSLSSSKHWHLDTRFSLFKVSVIHTVTSRQVMVDNVPSNAQPSTDMQQLEREEEAKLKAKYPSVSRPGPGFLQKRLQKGVRPWFDVCTLHNFLSICLWQLTDFATFCSTAKILRLGRLQHGQGRREQGPTSSVSSVPTTCSSTSCCFFLAITSTSNANWWHNTITRLPCDQKIINPRAIETGHWYFLVEARWTQPVLLVPSQDKVHEYNYKSRWPEWIYWPAIAPNRLLFVSV